MGFGVFSLKSRNFLIASVVVVGLILCFYLCFRTKSSPETNGVETDLNQKIEAQIDLILREFADEFKKNEYFLPVDACSKPDMSECRSQKFDTVFFAALAGCIISKFDKIYLKEAKTKLAEKLLAKQDDLGLWDFFFFSKTTSRHYYPDFDDVSLVAHFLSAQGVDFNKEKIKKIILEKQIEDGVFLTFYRESQPPTQSMVVDPVVNANVMMFLGYQVPQSCAFIRDFVLEGRISEYYRDDVVLFYMLSNSYANGVSCLREPLLFLHEKISKKIMAGGDAADISIMRLSLFITASINSQISDKERVWNLLNSLMKKQETEGIKSESLFFGGRGQDWYGSKEIVKLFLAEALTSALSALNATR